MFELWDDCAEAGEPAIVEAGAAVRRMILGFIRAHLPAGAPDGFTAEELAALAAARHSHAVFQPYAEPASEPAPATPASDSAPAPVPRN